MKRFFLSVLFPLLLLSPSAVWADQDSMIIQVMTGDLVPDENAAIGVVEALIRGKYGEEVLKQNQPLRVTRARDFWIVQGKDQGLSTSTARISRIDARVEEFLVFDANHRLLAELKVSQPDKSECKTDCDDAQDSGETP